MDPPSVDVLPTSIRPVLPTSASVSSQQSAAAILPPLSAAIQAPAPTVSSSQSSQTSQTLHMDPAAAFGDLEDNAPDGGWNSGQAWGQGSENAEEQKVVHRTGFGPAIGENGAPNDDDSTAGLAASSIVEAGSSAAGASAASAGATPAANSASSANSAAKRRRHRLIVKVTNIEPNKGDPIVWFDVQTTLPRFRSTNFRDVRRAYSEMRRFASHLASANPECFVPSLPPPSTSFPAGSEENDARLRANLQRWFDRITRSPLLARDEEFLYFVESSFGYVPVVKIRPPATGLARKVIKQLQPPEDGVEELREFRPVAKLVYQYAQEGQAKLGRVVRARRALSTALVTFGDKLQYFAAPDPGNTLQHVFARLSKIVVHAGEYETVKATMAAALYGDVLETVANDSYMIKETLTNRHILMRDLLKSQEASRTKHQRATQLKGATAISQAKVEDAISQLEDATQLEKRITSATRRVTDNLVVERPLALQRMESDLMGAMKEYALRFIDAERRILTSWESLKRDVRAADSRGGLSRLGRDPTTPRAPLQPSQRGGDSWSDRLERARDTTTPPKQADEVVDAKSAASLLAESVF